jgi:rod shape determining protein RodA
MNLFQPVPSRREVSILWPLWLSVLGLMVVGAAFISSATANTDAASHLPWWRYRVFTQAAAYGVGLVAAFALSLLDYGRIARWSLVAYWGAVILLVLVLIPGIGSDNGWGAMRWINLGPFQFQPSELAKLTFLFGLANYLSRPTGELGSPFVVGKGLATALLPFTLIAAQPDLGSAAVFMPIAFVQLLVAGAPRRFLVRFCTGISLVAALLLADALLVPAGWHFVPLKNYQRARIQVYFGVNPIPKDATAAQRAAARNELKRKRYNIEQALISVGSGGLTGKGWREGRQSALGYLPRTVAHNDFIFSVIAEEKGFLGSVTVLGLYAVLLFAGIRVAGEARDRLGRLLAVGVVTLLFTHVFVNIGMNIHLLPVKGIPLPLLSAGGTSVISSLVAIGILQNIHLYRRHY